MLRGVNFPHPRTCALLLASLAALAACSAVEPKLSPRDPPPNVPRDLLILEVPQHIVDALASWSVVNTLNLSLDGAQDRVGIVVLPPGHAHRILQHQVVTGMTVQEVEWCFLSHPTRVRDQGPPGGHTLCWEPPGLNSSERYWVRFDETGLAVAAGQY
jgi:hypothetical protein